MLAQRNNKDGRALKVRRAQVGQFQILQVLFVFISGHPDNPPFHRPHIHVHSFPRPPPAQSARFVTRALFLARILLLANFNHQKGFPRTDAMRSHHRLLGEMIKGVTDLNAGTSDVDGGGKPRRYAQTGETCARSPTHLSPLRGRQRPSHPKRHNLLPSNLSLFPLTWIVADSRLCGRNTRTAEGQLSQRSHSRARNPFSPYAYDPHSAALAWMLSSMHIPGARRGSIWRFIDNFISWPRVSRVFIWCQKFAHYLGLRKG